MKFQLVLLVIVAVGMCLAKPHKRWQRELGGRPTHGPSGGGGRPSGEGGRPTLEIKAEHEAEKDADNFLKDVDEIAEAELEKHPSPLIRIGYKILKCLDDAIQASIREGEKEGEKEGEEGEEGHEEHGGHGGQGEHGGHSGQGEHGGHSGQGEHGGHEESTEGGRGGNEGPRSTEPEPTESEPEFRKKRRFFNYN